MRRLEGGLGGAYASHVPDSPRARNRPPVLVSVGGLPATGKTTIARSVAAATRAAYVRLDTIERAVARAEGGYEASNGWVLPPGYHVAYEVAADQLRLGLDVVAESVNALAVIRDAWRDTALGAGARLVEVEVVCSDPAEHRRRAEERVLDIEGLANPTWEQITRREYERWERDRLVLDTALLTPEESTRRVLRAMED